MTLIFKYRICIYKISNSFTCDAVFFFIPNIKTNKHTAYVYNGAKNDENGG